MIEDLLALPRTRAEAVARGVKHYFTGKPCKHGHVSVRYVGGRRCVACEKEYQQGYYVANREKIRKRQKLRDNANRKKLTKDSGDTMSIIGKN